MNELVELQIMILNDELFFIADDKLSALEFIARLMLDVDKSNAYKLVENVDLKKYNENTRNLILEYITK